jgi:hypothetical protein
MSERFPIIDLPLHAARRINEISMARIRAHEKMGLVFHLRPDRSSIMGADFGSGDPTLVQLFERAKRLMFETCCIDEAFFQRGRQEFANHAAEAMKYAHYSYHHKRGPFA